MALTHEGHYYRSITDNALTDGSHYREIGRAQARALISYFNLPPSSEPDITFASWQLEHFTPDQISDAIIGSALADPDHDGWDNLTEYTFALNPNRPDPSPIAIVRKGGVTSLTFPRNQHISDVTLSLEHSIDLSHWTREDLGTSPNLEVQTILDIPRGKAFVDVVTVSHLSLSAQRYYRLILTHRARGNAF
jgi:hypothetical protein